MSPTQCDAEDEDSRDEGHSGQWRQPQATPITLCVSKKLTRLYSRHIAY